MPKFKEFAIRKGITFFSLPVPKQKFNDFDIFLFLPRTAKNVIMADMVTSLFEYNFTYQNVVRELREMYNASLTFSCNVLEDKVYICVNVSVLSDYYAFDDCECLWQRALEMICDFVLEADIDNKDLFYQIIQSTAGGLLTNSKVKQNYLERAFAFEFPNSCAAATMESSVGELDDVSYNDFVKFYKKLLRTAEVFVFANGDYDEECIIKYLKERFKEIPYRERVDFKKITDSFRADFLWNNEWRKDTHIQVAKEGVLSNLTTIYSLSSSKWDRRSSFACAYLYSYILNDIFVDLVCRKNGLAYGIEVHAFNKYGLIAIHGTLSDKNCEDILAFTLNKDVITLDAFSDDEISKMLTASVARIKNEIRKYNMNYFPLEFIDLIYYSDMTEEIFDDFTVSHIRDFARHLGTENYVGSYIEKQRI